MSTDYCVHCKCYYGDYSLRHCFECRQKALNDRSAVEANLKELARLNLSLEKLQSKMKFLRQPFDKGEADGPMEADVRILVQDREDEILHAHKFILVSF
jgi:hypothetical protein